jgi:catalase (peroxidase I)
MSVDYLKIREEIKSILKNPDWDDGSIGPVLVRLGWHASGTYSKETKTGGSNGGTMRFKPESTDGANAGLEKARAFLEPIKQKYNISYGDLWTLASVVAIEEMNGPKIPWKSGRVDVDPATVKKNPKVVVENGRLPDAAQGADHIRSIFYRMGFNDREIVALSGAHSLGR